MKYSKVSRIISIILSLILTLVLVGCAATVKQSDLLGKWTEENSLQIEGLPYKSIEFFADGKVDIAGIYHGTYKLMENGELQVTLQDGTVYQDPFKITGKKLTITQASGKSKTYIKE